MVSTVVWYIGYQDYILLHNLITCSIAYYSHFLFHYVNYPEHTNNTKIWLLQTTYFVLETLFHQLHSKPVLLLKIFSICAYREYKVYDNHPNKTVATKVIITFLSLILALNNFVFNSINYLQIMGCAMGTICEPAYANIFMAQFEKQHIYLYIKNKSILYLRYIDDIFLILTGTKQELLIFLEKLNCKHKTIRFEHNISYSNISFLDKLIYKDKNNTLQTTLYRKPTDQQSYLHVYSDHPRSLKRTIPYSQALRIKTICSTLTEYKKHCAILWFKLLWLAGMLGVATRQASSKSPEELKKISTKDLKDYVKKTILHQQFLLMLHLQ